MSKTFLIIVFFGEVCLPGSARLPQARACNAKEMVLYNISCFNPIVCTAHYAVSAMFVKSV